MSHSTIRAMPSSFDSISKRNFDKLAKFIYAYSGIKMPPSKLTMLEGRLRRRLRATGLPTFDSYCDYLFNQGGLDFEAVYLIDAVTTNKTDFFREPNHFTYMVNHALPELTRRGVRSIRAWSAACSTGAEPYTMAMLLNEYAEQENLDYTILATDLSTEVLRTAHLGIYPEELVDPVPSELRKKYVMRAVQKDRNEVRIVPKLRSKIAFGRLNLMDDKYAIGDPVHLIFCRNVMIYFDKTTQQAVLSRLCECLLPGGYLFIGHSETVSGYDLPLKTVANTVFQRT
jgi:chemotaxis protein methyltransferase CheR